MSRNSTVAGVTFLGLCSVARKSSRGSDRVATPTWPAWILPGSGTRSREELKQRALAAAREPDDSDTHPSFFPCSLLPTMPPSGSVGRFSSCGSRTIAGSDQGLFKLVSSASSRASSSSSEAGSSSRCPNRTR